MGVVIRAHADGLAVTECPNADDLARKRRPGHARLACGCDHFYDSRVVRIELEKLESLVCHRSVEDLEPAADAVMAPVRPRPWEEVDRPMRLPLHILVQQFEEWVALQASALDRVVKLPYRLTVRRVHRPIIAPGGACDRAATATARTGTRRGRALRGRSLPPRVFPPPRARA